VCTFSDFQSVCDSRAKVYKDPKSEKMVERQGPPDGRARFALVRDSDYTSAIALFVKPGGVLRELFFQKTLFIPDAAARRRSRTGRPQSRHVPPPQFKITHYRTLLPIDNL
jgi:hypothetical protein